MGFPLFLILAAYLTTRLMDMGLTALNLNHLAAHGDEIPPGFEKEIDQSVLTTMRRYGLESGRFGLIAAGFDLLVVLAFFFGGLLDRYNSWLAVREWPLLLAGPAFFLFLAYAQTLLSAPFGLYRTFVIEKRYGFTTQTLRLWLLDLLKGVLLTTLLAGLLLGGSFWLIEKLPGSWWLVVWLFFLAFSVFLLYLSPHVIEPLFNTFTPIADEELARRLRETMARAGISVDRVVAMDASRRSTHSNAYFSGIGRVKRIVLYDTLLAANSRDEIVAVLAHEAGHWRKKHLLKRLAASQLLALGGLYLAFRLTQGELLTSWFGLGEPTLYGKLLLAGFLGSIAAFPLEPLASFFSRRHEREADDFAVRLTSSPEALASAFVKLAKDNLSNLHPHPWYAAFSYSHPPLPERVARLLGAR
ncbi:MAG: M48 family metallopeptidase [Desulfobacteraceae bacterium]|nr:M48 family metallopeptidase [Desulfobacteraceae bacterium]